MRTDPVVVAAAARNLVATADPTSRFVCARAATHLLRQALEASLDDLWARRAPPLAGAPMRSQLISLPYYLPDEALARRVIWAWYAASQASHHHGFEMAPTPADLSSWLDVVDELVRATTPARA